jgi:multicomponent Na+:H+ antiporter subunit D
VALDVTIVGVILISLGLLSIFIGVTMALIQIDLKRLIGFAAVAEIGYILLAVGVGFYSLTETGDLGQHGLAALQGAIFHVFNDVLDIGLLFLVAGAILYVTRESNLNKLGGLAHSMKYSCVFFIIGLAAVSGLPPLNGFASKILIYESIYSVSPILAIVAILGSIVILAIFIKIFHAVFMGPRLPTLVAVAEAPKLMLGSMAIIAAVMIFFGLFPEYVIENIVDPAVNALLAQSTYIQAIGGA